MAPNNGFMNAFFQVHWCIRLYICMREDTKVEEKGFVVPDSAVCHSAPSSLQKQTSLRAIFHPQGILLMSAVVWLMVVNVQLHFTSWGGSFLKQTNNHSALHCGMCGSCCLICIQQCIHKHHSEICPQTIKASIISECISAQVRSLNSVQSHTWPLITSEGKDTARAAESGRDVLIHTRLTYTNRSCLRKEGSGEIM